MPDITHVSAHHKFALAVIFFTHLYRFTMSNVSIAVIITIILVIAYYMGWFDSLMGKHLVGGGPIFTGDMKVPSPVRKSRYGMCGKCNMA